MPDLVIGGNTYKNKTCVKFKTPNGFAYYYPHEGGIDISLTSSAVGDVDYDIIAFADTSLSVDALDSITIGAYATGYIE